MEHYQSVTAWAPATVANVSCGFDIMGFAIRGTGDKVTVSLNSGLSGDDVVLTGPFGHLIPAARNKNTAGVAVDAYLKTTGNMDLHPVIALEKNMPLGSGMGSSAASSAAAVFALNHLLGSPLPVSELIPFAMEGERIACGSAHADNVAPALLGGFVLIRSYDPLDIITIQCPEDLFCAVVHPQIELKTNDARRILKQDISMADVIRQSANAASFMVALARGDYDLLGRSMQDLLAEPRRTQLIPGFDRAKQNALQAGAAGCGISGSGPSVFALCRGEITARSVSVTIQQAFRDAGLESDAWVSSPNAPGTTVIEAVK
jgi:homoserine kinase